MPEMTEQIDKIADGIQLIQTKHEEFSKAEGGAKALAKEAIEKMEKEFSPLIQQMQDTKQIIEAQKVTLEEIQKEMASGSKSSDDKSAFAEYDQHFARYLKKNTPIPAEDIEKVCNDIARKSLFGVDDEDLRHFSKKELIAGSNISTGYFLTTDRSSIISKRIFETAPVRSLASTFTTTSDMWEMILDDEEPDAGWVGEVSSRPETDTAGVALIKIPIHELYANPKASQKMLDDAGFDIAAWHQGKVSRKFSRLENTAFVSGNGSQKPKGFLTYPAWTTAGTYQRNAVEQVETSTASEIGADDLIKLQGSLIEDYMGMASWGMKRKTFFENILTLKDDQGQYLINPMLIREGGQLVLLGQPVVLMNDMPEVADSALSVIIAAWREFYTIVDRIGIRVVRDEYTAKPFVLFYTTKRVGAAVTNYEAGKILKIKAA